MKFIWAIVINTSYEWNNINGLDLPGPKYVAQSQS